MIRTIDKNGIKRTMSLTNYERLTDNHDGTRGANKIRPVVDEKVISSVEQDIASFIEKKKCKSNPEKDCTGVGVDSNNEVSLVVNSTNNEIMAEPTHIEVPIIDLPKVQPKKKRNAKTK